MSLFTNLEIIIMVSVIGFLGLLVVILTILEIVSNHKAKNEIKEVTQEENKEVEAIVQEEIEQDDIDIAGIDITKPLDIIKETILEKKTTPEKVTISVAQDIKEQEVIAPVIAKPAVDEILIEDIDEPTFTNVLASSQEIKVQKVEPVEVLELEPTLKAKIELQKIEESLEHQESLEDTISNLEALEEENAIISYQELLSATKELSIVNVEDEGNEPISISEVLEKFNYEDNLKTEFVSNDSNFDYQNSPTEIENLNEIQLENTANIEKLDKEIRKTNKFLNILNELKKNLD